MKKLVVGAVAVAMLMLGTNAFSQELDVATPDDAKVMAVGAYLGMGMSVVVGEDTPDDNKPKFAGGFGAYFDFYIIPMLALTGGLDFQNKGGRVADGDNEARVSLFYLDIPLGVKLNIQNFRAALMVCLNFGMTGKSKWEFGDESGDDDYEWDNTRRFNLSPKIALGYGIPIGPITLVPGLSWSMHLIKDGKENDGIDAANVRNMLLMFTFGAEFGF